MIVFNGLPILIAQLESLDQLGTLFVNSREWSTTPESATFLLLSGDNELENLDDNGAPILAISNNVEYLLGVEMFQSVIELQMEKKPDSSLRDYIYAINHYLEYDDFYEPR